MAYLIDGSPFKHFSLREVINFETKKDIKLVLTRDLIKHGDMMDFLREYYRKPLNVSSWYREKDFNARVGGHTKSCHLDGIATDILLPGISNNTRTKLTTAWNAICISQGVIGGVGVYSWGMHFDSNNTIMRYGRALGTFRYEDFR